VSDGVRVADGISTVVSRKKTTKNVNGRRIEAFPKEADDAVGLRDAVRVLHRRKKRD